MTKKDIFRFCLSGPSRWLGRILIFACILLLASGCSKEKVQKELPSKRVETGMAIEKPPYLIPGL